MLLVVISALLCVALFAYKHFTSRPIPKSPLGALSKAVDPDVPSEPPSKKIILVTGGCGFLGSTCVEMLAEQGEYDEVRVFDIVKGHVVGHPKVKFVQGDLTKLDDCLRVVDGCSAVLHMGAIVDMRETPFAQGLSQFINVQGTWNILEASIRRGVRAFVYTSSNSAIHTNKRGVEAKSEADVLALFANSTPSTSYGKSKKAATQWVLANDKVGRMRTTVLMPGVVLGPREPRLLAPILDDTHVHLFKPELSGSLNFCHSRSLAQAHILAADRLLAGDKSVPGHIFMISDGIENVIQVEVLFREALGKGPGKILGAISYIVVAVAYLANWITNDRWNNPLVQLTSTTIGLIFNGPIMSSTFEAEKALGWKPSSMDAILKALVDYYKPSIKK